jgi:hypothetical protein
MERRTLAWVGAGAVVTVALCGGFVWACLRVASGLASLAGDGGDGLFPEADPRPGRAIVEVTDDAGRPVAGARVEAVREPLGEPDEDR